VNLYLAAMLVLLAGAFSGLLLRRRPALALRVGSAAAVVGSLLGLAAVLPFLLGAAPAGRVLPWSEPVGAFHLRLDPLAAFFQVALFAVAIPASVFGAGYMKPYLGRRPLAGFVFFYDLLLVAISLVLAAADGVLFLVAWEVMTIASFVLVTFDDEKPQVRKAGFVFLVASHVGTAFLVALFLLLGRDAGGFDFERFEALRSVGTVAPAILFGLGLVGFGTKAGLVPLHVWLPEAHPAAPSHVSALLSAVMIKTGVYGLFRLLGFLPGLPVGYGILLGAVGLGSALVAITLTLGQRDIKRALAYSSVENVGLVVLGIGLGVAATAEGLPVVAALGFGGALFHVWNHALMKGLAFLGAGTLVHAAHSQDLEKMGGLLARLPITGTLFLVGAATLAALPPLAGFSSEWLLYLGLLSGSGAATGAESLVGYLAVATLALVGALAAISFTRIAGVALLGAPRSLEAASAHEVPPSGWAPLAVLAAGCVLFGVFPSLPLRLLSAAAVQVGGAHVAAVLAPAAASAAAPRTLALLFLALAGGLAWLGHRLRASRPAASSETWGCGFTAPTPRMEYTAASYSQLILSGLVPRPLRPRIHLQAPRGIFPGRASFRTDSQDPARTRLFDPLFRTLGDRMSRLRRFQAGRLNLQLLYTVVTVLALLVALALRGGLR
jgi:formate hydrogenlyase subunit 3/multisubunit Na+/H+ antiporter MnhD subunit